MYRLSGRIALRKATLSKMPYLVSIGYIVTPEIAAGAPVSEFRI